MSGLWVLWVFYCLAFFTDVLYVQPYRERKAREAGRAYGPGSLSFGLRASLPLFTLLIVGRTFFLDVYRIPTGSMEPLLSQGSSIWVNRVAYGLRSPVTGKAWFGANQPEEGEVIVFRYPREPRTTYVKRVLGTPGDHVKIHGDSIQVNDVLLFDTGPAPAGQLGVSATLGRFQYAILDDPNVQFVGDIDLVVPPGHFFAIGDNINNSEDSRVWGLLSERHLIGRVVQK